MNKFKLKRFTIFWKFFASQIATIIFLGIILIIATVYLVCNNLREDLLLYANTTLKSISTETNHVAKEYDNFFFLNIMNSQVFSQSLNNSKELKSKKLRKFLLQFYQMQLYKESITSMYAYTPNHNLYYARSANCDLLTDENHFIKNYLDKNYDNLIKNNKNGEFFVLNNTPDSIFYIRSIYSEFLFEYEGLLVVEINANDFYKSILQNFAPKKGDILITNDAGRVIYNSSNLQDIPTISPDNLTNNFTTIKINNVNYSVLTINVEDKLFNITYYIENSEMYNKLSNMLIINTILIVSYLILALIVTFYVSSNLTSGIRQLAKNIKYIHDGKLFFSKRSHSNDEIGELEDAFYEMSSQLESIMHKLVAEQSKKEQLEHELLIAEYNKLLSQINPHFLYNVLESINAYSKNINQYEIASIIQKLGLLMRNNLQSQGNFTKLQCEIEYITNYISIYNFMLGGRIELVCDIDDNLMNCKIPKLILQPLVENTIKHSVEHTNNTCLLYISTYQKNNDLVLEVSDDGLGISDDILQTIKDGRYHQNKKDNRTHIGLSSINKRIETLYGTSYGLSIHSEIDVGTVVTVTIPLDY